MSLFETRPTLVGHRGLGKGTVNGFAENTMESFLAAVDSGLSWVEVDVGRTADNALVVAHDPTYPDGTFIDDITTDQATARGSLLLTELLESLPDTVGVDLDLKSCMSDSARKRGTTTAGLLAPIAAAAALNRPVLVTSFDPGAVMAVRELAPGVPLGLSTNLCYPADITVAAASQLDVQVIAPNHRSLMPPWWLPNNGQRPTGEIIDRAHAAGLEILTWCPGRRRVPKLIAAGVEALCVNDVPAMVELLDR